MLGCSELAARPVRRTAWLVSALSHHLGPEGEGGQVDNEVVVLATGVDQYLQETFHHLDGEGDGLISGEDFRRLCSVLGLPGDGGPAGLLAGLPAELTFRQFHARLCEHFQQRGEEGPGRLPVGEETEHIERQIRLRCPRRQRRRRKQQHQQQCVSFDLSAQGWRPRPTAGAPQGRGAPAAAPLELELELENASLRELVEDLRGALQSSDARCLALQVGLQKFGGPSGRSSWPRERRARSGEGSCSARPGCRGFQSLVRELELIRSSRDGQIDEAMRFNQELEEELRAAHGLLVQWEHSASALKAGNALVRKKAERARAAILEGMEKVKELESRAKQIPELQSRIQELEQELERCRSQEGQGKKAPALLNSSQHFQKYCRSSQSDWNPSCQQTRSPPTGKADSVSESRECSWHNGNPSCNEDEGRLLRAVEGRAASDEEEERCTQDRQCQMMELNKDSGSGEGSYRFRSSTLRRLLSHNCSCANKEGGSIVPPVWMDREQELSVLLKNKEAQVTELQTETEKWTCSMTKELQLKGEEVEMLRMELQMVETDRVRLSLIEEKLTDVLQLLQQLRVLNIPRRWLGKILMNTLDSCYSAGHGTMGSLDMLSVLHKELLSCELLTKGSSQTENQQGMKNSLVISC